MIGLVDFGVSHNHKLPYSTVCVNNKIKNYDIFFIDNSLLCLIIRDMTHKELVTHARQLLQSRFQCNPVFTEQGSAKISEMPDAIGWSAHDCWVIECKRNLADFRADRKKPHRQTGNGLGSRRIYLITEALYQETKETLGTYPLHGWGLMIADPPRSPRRRSILIESVPHTSDMKAERDFLRSRILEIQRFGK